MADKKRDCFECDHCGMYMDMDPYCVAPEVTKKHPYGLVVRQARPDVCKGDMWTERKPR